MTRRTIAAVGAFSIAALASVGDAHAQEANGFGARAGQLIVSADRLIPVFGYTSVSETVAIGPGAVTTSRSGSSMSILYGNELGVGSVHSVPRAAIDVTVVPRLTLGGSAILAFTVGGSREVETEAPGVRRVDSFDAPSVTIFGFAPRVGYILPVGRVLAFWFRGGLSFYSVRTRSERSIDARDYDVDSDTLLSLDLDPQLAIVPFEHFFITVGPLVNIPLTGSRTHEEVRGPRTDTTDRDLSVFHLGAHVSIGGWFNL